MVAVSDRRNRQEAVSGPTVSSTAGLLTPGKGLPVATGSATGGTTVDRPHGTQDRITADAARRAAQARAARAASVARRGAAARRRALLAGFLLVATVVGWAAVGLSPLVTWVAGVVAHRPARFRPGARPACGPRGPGGRRGLGAEDRRRAPGGVRPAHRRDARGRHRCRSARHRYCCCHCREGDCHEGDCREGSRHEGDCHEGSRSEGDCHEGDRDARRGSPRAAARGARRLRHRSGRAPVRRQHRGVRAHRRRQGRVRRPRAARLDRAGAGGPPVGQRAHRRGLRRRTRRPGRRSPSRVRRTR